LEANLETSADPVLENRPGAKRYALAVLAAVAALALRRILSPILGPEVPFLTLWPAVVFSSWFCGVGPSIVSVLIGAVGAWYWFLPPYHSFMLQTRTFEISGLMGFLVLSALIVAMGESNRQTRIRERKTLAEAAAATAKFRAVFEQTTVFAGVLTLEGVVIEANRLCLEACGYRAEEVLGRPFWETGWFHGSKELQSKVREATLQAAQGTPFHDVFTYYWADESEHIVDFVIHPIRDGEGRVIFLHPTGADITELKTAEESYRKLAEALDLQVRERTKELLQRNFEVLKQSELLRSLSQRLIEIQDQERRKIARELHDSAGQVLAALGMHIQAIVADLRTTSPALAKNADECEQMIRQLSQEIRTISYLLHPPLLDEMGLSSALKWYVQGLAERGGLDISLSIPDDLERFSHELELALFRLVQECLTNVYRHSGSKTAAIGLFVQKQGVHLEVRDEGKGISPEKLAGIQTQGSGVGMQGMRERVRQFHGEMNVQSDDAGTAIRFIFPMQGPEPSRQWRQIGPLQAAE